MILEFINVTVAILIDRYLPLKPKSSTKHAWIVSRRLHACCYDKVHLNGSDLQVSSEMQ